MLQLSKINSIETLANAVFVERERGVFYQPLYALALQHTKSLVTD
jgi:hypothetical protein